MLIVRAFLALVVMMFAAAAVLFAGFIFQTFSLKSSERNADAIVVLTGGLGRVEEGLRLYRQGKGGALFLVGVDPAVRKRDLFRERPGERIYMENLSRDTYENAVYARELMDKHNVRSVLLITSRYHMKRAVLIFRNVFPKDVAIYPHPVDTRNLKSNWWSHGGSFRLLFSEFYKYYLYRIFFLLGSGESPAATFSY